MVQQEMVRRLGLETGPAEGGSIGSTGNEWLQVMETGSAEGGSVGWLVQLEMLRKLGLEMDQLKEDRVVQAEMIRRKIQKMDLLKCDRVDQTTEYGFMDKKAGFEGGKDDPDIGVGSMERIMVMRLSILVVDLELVRIDLVPIMEELVQ